MPFPLWKRQLGQLAQLVEHRPYKAGATGSSPVLPTKEIKGIYAKISPKHESDLALCAKSCAKSLFYCL